MRSVCDLHGREAGLGVCLGRGGEGVVYSVPMWPRSVAKIYAHPPDDRTSRKLGAMVQLGTKELAASAAWPEDLVLDAKTGETLGFRMPRLDEHRPIHALYGPSDRQAAFPDAGWAFLVRAARNVAAAFQTVHAHGHVIGDVNQGNVVVSRAGTVRLIDCDSFQIQHLGRTYPCRVGVPLYTPPELQGRRLDELVRSVDHDRFGLAVLIFQLLFMGRHPFAGRHPTRALAVEEAIRETLFAYGDEAARLGWEPPPFSLGLGDVTPELRRLFEAAFGKEAAQGAPRPEASTWIQALDAMEAGLVTCGDDPRHAFLAEKGSCTWCRLERAGGPSFFLVAPGAASDAFDAPATWRSIQAVLSPGPAPVPPSVAAVTPGAEPPAGDRVAALRGALGQLVRGLGLSPEPLERPKPLAEREALRACERRLHTLLEHWRLECGDERFEQMLEELGDARTHFELLEALEAREREALAERFRRKLLEPHLESFRLEFSRIPGLGRAELSRLAACGVRTAADISPETLMAVPDVNLAVVRALLVYKGVAAQSLAFDPETGIPGKHRAALAESQARRRTELVERLAAGPLKLAEERRRVLTRREELAREIQEALDEHARLSRGASQAG